MTWQKAWQEGRTPWDAGGSPPILERLVAEGSLPEGRALVPGAGSGYDVLTLASDRRHALGIDLSPIARERFEQLRRERGVSEHCAQLVVHDFFEGDFGSGFDLVWDYTFLCALEPSMRERWLERMHELISPGGELVTLIFPVVDGDPASGPPYPMSPELVESLVSPRFAREQLVPVSESRPGREGKEWLGRWRRR